MVHFGESYGGSHSIRQEQFIIQLYCPLCKKSLMTRYDYYKMETSCKNCGLLLRAPPEYGIVYPEVIRKKNKIKK